MLDERGQSSSCAQKYGSVAAKDNNVVITGWPELDTLLGPLIRYGTNPWPWFYDRHRAEAEKQAQILTRISTRSGFLPFRYHAFTANSTAVSGIGTAFTTTFCQGPASPGLPEQVGGTNVSILVRSPPPSSKVTVSAPAAVASCQSDNQLTLAEQCTGRRKTAPREDASIPFG